MKIRREQTMENSKESENGHKCALCPYSSRILKYYKRHLKIHSAKIPGFFCTYPNCNYSTNRKDSLVSHTRIHTGEKPFKCQFESCSYAATQQSHLIIHTRTHTKERPYKCPELDCDYSAAVSSSINTHQLTHHSKPEDGAERHMFSCPICPVSTKSKTSLSAHIRRHTLIKSFKCDQSNCNFETTTKRNLEDHKLVHSNEKPFACPLESCEYRCKFKHALSNHLKIHSDQKQHKCELCPYRARQRNVVLNHLKTVHSQLRPFQCLEPKCDHASKTKSDLKKHLLFHGGEKNYSCSFPGCDYKAVTSSIIKSHQINKHETEKRFKCELCGFATKIKRILAEHMRTHLKETSYFS